MAFPAICSPRSARLLLTGSEDLPTFALKTSLDVRPVVKNPPVYFPGMKPLARPWRLPAWRKPHVDDLQKKLPAPEPELPPLPSPRLDCQPSPVLSLPPVLARGRPLFPPPAPILKRAEVPAKPRERHVSFGNAVVHEVERFPWRVFPPPRFAVFEPKRRSFPLRLPSPLPEELPRRQRYLEVTVRGPTMGQWLGWTACAIGVMTVLSWL